MKNMNKKNDNEGKRKKTNNNIQKSRLNIVRTDAFNFLDEGIEGKFLYISKKWRIKIF